MRALIALSALLVASGALAGPPTSGEYGSATIATDAATSMISGHYANATGYDDATKAPRFTCDVAFAGTIAGDRAAITAGTPGTVEVIPGTLTWTAEGVRLKLDSLPGGCANVDPDLAGPKGTLLTLTEAAPDILAVRVVRDAGSVISPGKGDGVAVSKGQVLRVVRGGGEESVMVLVKKGSRSVRGLFPVKGLYPLPAPAPRAP